MLLAIGHRSSTIAILSASCPDAIQPPFQVHSLGGDEVGGKATSQVITHTAVRWFRRSVRISARANTAPENPTYRNKCQRAFHFGSDSD